MKRPNNNLRLLFLSLFSLFLGTASLASAQEKTRCIAPTPAQLTSTTEYVAKRYKVPSDEHLQLASNDQADDNCLWRLVFSSTRKKMTFFYSADRRYIFPVLYDLRKDPDAEENKVREAIRQDLQAGSPPAYGSPRAHVDIVEFTDFQCPYCKQMWDNLRQGSVADDPDVRLLVRQFPLKAIHPWANLAAHMSSCVYLQSNDLFWRYSDFLYQNQKDLKLSSLQSKSLDFLEGLRGFDQPRFQDCLNNSLSDDLLKRDEELATKWAVQATPTLFINGQRVQGLKSVDELKTLIAEARKVEDRKVARKPVGGPSVN